MKITYTILLLLVLFTMLTASECRKTTTPEFYFKCKVDGQEYIPNSCANCLAATILEDTTLIMNANRGFETIGFGINESKGIQKGTYFLINQVGRRATYKKSTTTNDYYRTQSIYPGELTIKEFDKASKIIGGTFSFRAYHTLSNDSVIVSSGEFRLKYKTD